MQTVVEDLSNGFKVALLRFTPQPQTAFYQALHQDYSSDWVGDSNYQEGFILSESECGEISVKRLLHGNVLHAGVLEHAHMMFSCGYINHGTMQQFRTHRLLSFDVQSFRYTDQHIINAAYGIIPIEDVIYLRPIGEYSDRNGGKYNYTKEIRDEDLRVATIALMHVAKRLEQGCPAEQARGVMPFDYRQHFVFSGNLRAILHVLDLRLKKDTQYEFQCLSWLIWKLVCEYVPEIGAWYEQKRLGKASIGF